MDRDKIILPLVLQPQERLNTLTKDATNFDVHANIPPRRYYRSGVEMVRMAQVYCDEGNLESAYILYFKFMVLFIEKIRTHPDFSTVSAKTKQENMKQLRSVIPIAENLKKKLLEQYKSEYEQYKIYLKKIEEENAKKKSAEEERRKQLEKSKSSQYADIPSHLTDYSQRVNVHPVPPLLNELNYPDFNTPQEPGPSPVPSAPKLSSLPDIDRSTKPSIVSSYSPPPSNLRSDGLRRVTIPENLTSKFLVIAKWNTDRNIETCAILAGKLKQDQLVISHLLVPTQSGTADSCLTQNEEDIFDYQDQHDLITIGWIHTHPSQTAFLSSVDLHTHYSYQRMMPEAVAIVCAPRYNESKSFFLTHFGLALIGNCQKSGFHPHPSDEPLFMESEHTKVVAGISVEVIDLRR